LRRHEFFFWLIRIPLDLLIVIGAFLIAREIRVTTDLIPGISLPYRTLDLNYLLGIAGVSYAIIGTIFSFQKLYTLEKLSGIIEEIFTIIKSVFVAFFIMIGLLYLTNGFPYNTILIPRLILIYAFLFSMVGIIIERIFIRWIRVYGFTHGWFQKKRILLIMNHSEPHLEKSLIHQYHITIVGYLSPFSQMSHFKYQGTIGNHAEVIEDADIDEVIILSHDLPYELKKTLFEYCQIHGIAYRYIGNMYETAKNNTHIDFMGRIPLVEIRTIWITAWGRVVKRAFDVSLSVILLLILLPAWILLSFIIVLESPGFPFYISSRVGRGGRKFSMIKFRSMTRDAELIKSQMPNERTDGPLFKLTNDPRITKFGKWIRRWSIDEIPQILNVLRGDMSFIGPRPHLPTEVNQYSEKQRQVLTIKPGITGMAQVYGRDTNSFDREIELDLFYIENWSLLLDTKILLLTFRAVFQGK
jgi:exopolysaccharide biosynthesis polyprenyl glycosylphosphotransferase